MRWVDDDQRPLPPIEQEGLVGSSHINPNGKDENLQGTSEDPTPCLQSVLSGVCGGGNELAPTPYSTSRLVPVFFFYPAPHHYHLLFSSLYLY
jgi:hypothetical protein